jgi:hypothetical protein
MGSALENAAGDPQMNLGAIALKGAGRKNVAIEILKSTLDALDHINTSAQTLHSTEHVGSRYFF